MLLPPEIFLHTRTNGCKTVVDIHHGVNPRVDHTNEKRCTRTNTIQHVPLSFYSILFCCFNHSLWLSQRCDISVRFYTVNTVTQSQISYCCCFGIQNFTFWGNVMSSALVMDVLSILDQPLYYMDKYSLSMSVVIQIHRKERFQKLV